MPAPIILSTWSFARKANNAAFPALLAGGSALDAVEKIATLVEADQNVDSVGFGGLPDSAGHVTLDACIMTHPNRCGSVCAVRRFMHPVSIARKVMEQTSHVMLAGEGADAFAMQQGFMPADLLSADALDAYEKWKKDHATPNQSHDRGNMRSALEQFSQRPIDHGDSKSGKLFFHPAPPDFDESRWKHHDTVGALALDANCALAGACSTSGTPYKMPGRVGDSPIVGHGLYVHARDGGATATGAGELIMGVCGSFLAVENMRRGMDPVEAICDVLRRITEEHEIKAHHQVAMIALRPDGAWGAAALRKGYMTSVKTSEIDEARPAEKVLLLD